MGRPCKGGRRLGRVRAAFSRLQRDQLDDGAVLNREPHLAVHYKPTSLVYGPHTGEG